MADYQIKYQQLGQLKEKNFIVIDDVICKIDSISKSKPGKHGAAKVRLTATAVFSGKKMNLLKPSNADVIVPLLDKGNAQVIADLGEKYQIMDTSTYETLDVEKRDFKDLATGDEVEYVKAGSEIKIVKKR